MESSPEPEPPLYHQLSLFLGQLAWNSEDIYLERPVKIKAYNPEVAEPGRW